MISTGTWSVSHYYAGSFPVVSSQGSRHWHANNPIAAHNVLNLQLDINATFQDTTLFGDHFSCWSEPTSDLCCLPDFSATVQAQYPESAGALGGVFNLFLACGAFADPSLDGCSVFECFEYVLLSPIDTALIWQVIGQLNLRVNLWFFFFFSSPMLSPLHFARYCQGTPGCEGFSYGAQDDNGDGVADFNTCGFASDGGCTLANVPDCQFFHIDTFPTNCSTTSTFDCSRCEDCDPGFFLDNTYSCVQNCPTGYYGGTYAWHVHPTTQLSRFGGINTFSFFLTS